MRNEPAPAVAPAGIRRWNARYAPIMMLKQTVSLSLVQVRVQMAEAHYKNLSHPFRPKFMVIEPARFS